ncbi:crotonobetainyl-CoA:carnitine CoA-transferase CaiB-like acyl-CoA transferase [Cupriavidus metallidurans]|jgi:crotonobetainyl-CoA:carnitine CoA-transferase CaiB-like acyl-CoA transferase|uniref:CoA transferase n=1 Tax=Cupriavidus TaxID=106589 RepID=UPI0004930B20|nr:CoA transferase [Cupriavidus metallidurans]AVA34116.1 CoA transferase [Cupriavidus metallidurans]KWW35061.1 putative CoA-transferase [Cupriavidus metallidurans]MDE4922246.1 CoA transferase [Cupriavidus metallidurans]
MKDAAAPAPLALGGLRVLEVGTGPALAYAGKLFADFGAEVIKVERPKGDVWRQMPPLVSSAKAQPESALFAWLNTNKRSVTADSADAADRAWLARLARTCDVVLDARALTEGVGVLSAPVWAVAAAAAVDGQAGHEPIEVALTWFGESGPYSEFAGSEAVCRCLAGAVHGSGPMDGPPHMPHDVQTAIVGGLMAYSAAVAALIGGAQGSRRYVLSLHEAVFSVVEMEAGMVPDKRHPLRRLGVNRFCGTHPAGIYETASGWIGIFTHTLPQWTALCEAIGRPELARDPRFANGQERMNRADEIDAILIPAFRTRTAQEWFELLGDMKHPTVLVPTMQELLGQAVHRERGAFVPVRIGGTTFEGPVVPLRLDAAGPLAGGDAPLKGADDAFYRASGLDHRPLRQFQRATTAKGPLEGIRVIDLTMGWAGPLASRTLADFGAEVIKVESTSYPDWWRGANFTEEFYRERLYEKNSNFNLMNRNKQGITLDLTREEGKRLLLELVEGADAVIENYSAEVLPKLGLDYEALRARNKRLVMVSMPAFGLGNAWSNTRAYGGTLEQASGLPLYTGHPDGPPAMTSYAYGDPIGGLNAGAAMLLALFAQQATGAGRHVNLSQVEAMLPMAAPFMIEQSISGAVSPRQGNRHPMLFPYGCFRCDGDDAWVVLSATDAHWPALCRVIERDDLAADAQLASVSGRRARGSEIDAAISAWCAGRDPEAAMQTLQHAGIPAGVVRPMSQVLQDAHLHARGFWRDIDRAHSGPYRATTAWFRTGSEPQAIRYAAPTLGEHTESVLARVLALGPAQIAELERIGVTGKTAQPKVSKGRA